MGRLEERYKVRTSARDQIRIRPCQRILGCSYLLQQSVHQGCAGKIRLALHALLHRRDLKLRHMENRACELDPHIDVYTSILIFS